jgi:hypothetical protein
MAFGASHGSRQRISISPAASLQACSSRAMGVFGLAHREGLPVGRTAG